MILNTRNLTKRFGGIVALDDVSVVFHPGSISALVGPNGAGKSTLFNVVAGLVPPDSGEVTLGKRDDIRLTGLQPHAIARHGVGMLFQDSRVFRKLTAIENVAVGAQSQQGEYPLLSLLHHAKAVSREREVQDLARHHLDFVGLADKSHVWAEHLSYGEQKLVALARLLAADSRVLLLDEPTSGIHPNRIRTLLDIVQRLADDHVRTIVMIEHNREVVASISDHVFQMDSGRIIASGTGREMSSFPEFPSRITT